MLFQDFTQRGFLIAGNITRQGIQENRGRDTSHRASSALGAEKEPAALHEYVLPPSDDPTSPVPLSLFYGRFKYFRASHDDLAVHELPANAISNEEIVDGFLERRLVMPGFQTFPDAFNNVVHLEPLTPIYMPLRFVPDVRVFTPVAGVRPLFKNSAGNVPDGARAEA
jgi:hypothetical protein